jgi:hypothetical protein
MADIFISYAREDRQWVETLANALQADGFSVWWDWDLLVGKRYREAIETELSSAKAAVVVWSQYSIHSDFVRDEAEEGQQRNILVPILKETVRPPAGFRQLQTADLTTWSGGIEHAEFQRMLRGIAHVVGRPPGPGARVAPSAVGATAEASNTKADSPSVSPETVAPTVAKPASFVTPAAAPLGLASLAGKPTGAQNPIWRYVAIGAVAIVAVLFVIGSLWPNNPSAKPIPTPGGLATKPLPVVGGGIQGGGNGAGGSTNANGDVAGNAHGATATTTGRNGSNSSGGNSSTPAPAGGDSGGDVGQTGPHHKH